MRTSLKTTTAVLACLNLALPTQGFAQGAVDAGGDDSVCVSDPASEACHDLIADGVDGDGEGIDESEIGDVPDPGAGIETGADGEAGDVQNSVIPDAGQSPTAAEGGAAADEETAAPDASTQDVPVDGGETEVGPETGVGGEDASPSTQMPDATSDQMPDATSDVAAPDVIDAREGDDAQPDGGAVQPDAQPSETDAQGDAGDAAPPAVEDDAQQLSPDVGEAVSQPQPEAIPADPPETGAEEPAEADDVPEDGARAQPVDEAPEAAQPESAPQDTTAPQSDEVDGSGTGQTRSSEGGEAVAEPAQDRETPAALEAGSGDAEPQEVVTETVTEESARASSEDFESGIDQSPDEADDAENGGLSDLERALLLGAGALAVGAIMRGGREVVASSDDRVVVSGSDGGYQLIKDDNALLRQPGSEVQTQTFDDGSTRSVVMREDGSQIVTIRDAELRVVRRASITPDGEEIVLIDDTEEAAPVDTSALTASAETRTFSSTMDDDALRQALAAQQGFDRGYSLNQIRSMEQVRAQVPAIDLETITFASGSAAISPEQADELTQLGRYIAERIEENPREIFLVEGHTDAVGDAAYNLALSDRRAESVALALTEYFGVPPENLVVQGYGEQFLKVQVETAEQANRRATLRRVTPLLQAAAAGQ